MTKGQAIEAYMKGYKITHKYFTPDQYIYLHKGDTLDEAGNLLPDDYFSEMKGETWETDWEIFDKKPTLVGVKAVITRWILSCQRFDQIEQLEKSVPQIIDTLFDRSEAELVLVMAKADLQNIMDEQKKRIIKQTTTH